MTKLFTKQFLILNYTNIKKDVKRIYNKEKKNVIIPYRYFLSSNT